MKRYRGIEGLRAWLAWTVVLAHLVGLSGLSPAVPHLHIIITASTWAVDVFMIISGFVITHLILERHESYGAYIVRRFLRIYPAYVICLILGIFVTKYGLETLTQISWGQLQDGAPPAAPGPDIYGAELNEMTSSKLPWHILLHFLLLHGVVPDKVLNYASITLLNPAWSLSLEWQFYLVAPFLIWLCKRSHWGTVALITSVSLALWGMGVFGGYSFSSFLPLVGPLFFMGIATRFYIDHLPRLKTYPTAVIFSFMIIFMLWAPNLIPFVIWLAMICYLICGDAAFANPTFALRTIHSALDSELANAAGERSYSVYLFHWVAVCGALYIFVHVVGLSAWPMFFALSATTIAVTVLGSEMLYRFVEKPGMNIGRLLAGSRTKSATVKA